MIGQLEQNNHEGNLKLLETMQIPAMCYELEEFMHGPHRTVHENSYLVFIHTHNEGYDMMTRFINFAQQQKAHIIVIDDDQNSSSDIIIPQWQYCAGDGKFPPDLQSYHMALGA